MNALWLPPALDRRVRRGLPRLGVIWTFGGVLFGGMTAWWASVLSPPDSANTGLLAGLGVLPSLCLVLTGVSVLPVRRIVRNGWLDLAAARRIRRTTIGAAVACLVCAAGIAVVFSLLSWEYAHPFSLLFPSAMAPGVLSISGAVGAASMLPPSPKVLAQFSPSQYS